MGKNAVAEIQSTAFLFLSSRWSWLWDTLSAPFWHSVHRDSFFHLHSSDVLTHVNLFLFCYSHSFTLKRLGLTTVPREQSLPPRGLWLSGFCSVIALWSRLANGWLQRRNILRHQVLSSYNRLQTWKWLLLLWPPTVKRQSSQLAHHPLLLTTYTQKWPPTRTWKAEAVFCWPLYLQFQVLGLVHTNDKCSCGVQNPNCVSWPKF